MFLNFVNKLSSNIANDSHQEPLKKEREKLRQICEEQNVKKKMGKEAIDGAQTP